MYEFVASETETKLPKLEKQLDDRKSKCESYENGSFGIRMVYASYTNNPSKSIRISSQVTVTSLFRKFTQDELKTIITPTFEISPKRMNSRKQGPTWS